MTDEIANIWDERSLRDHMYQAYLVAQNSTDRSTKNGAILVRMEEILCSGCNRHVDGYGMDEEDHERPLKYEITEHAERDVIYKAAFHGIRTRGATMVANWVACPPCARAIAAAGIVAVVCHKECMDRTPERWADQVNLGLDILKRRGVEVIQWSGDVGRIENLNNGEIWLP